MFSKSLCRLARYAAALGALALTHATANAQQKEFEGTKIVVNGFGGNLDDVLVENVSKVLQAEVRHHRRDRAGLDRVGVCQSHDVAVRIRRSTS